MLPKVSIILPVYNAEKTIERCVGSIVNQEYKDFELILVNDGSDDSTGALCGKWAGNDPRVRVIHKENSGVSDSRNLALEEACGEYLQFVDSDDWLSPEATGCFVETAERYQCDLVISDFYRVAGDRKSHKGNIHEEGPFSLETYAAYMMEKPADFYYGVLWNKLYRREIVERYGLRMDSSVSWCEDFMFNLEYLRYAKVFCAVQIPLYYYVKNKNSLSTQGMSLSNTVKMKKAVFACYNNFYKNVFTEEEYEKIRPRINRFLIDAARDGVVPFWAKKLGEDGSRLSFGGFNGKGMIAEWYRQRKLLDCYLEPIAIRYELSLKEVRLLFYLAEAVEAEEPCSKQELADLLSESVQDVSHQLRRLEGREYFQAKAVSQKDGHDRGRWKPLQIAFLPGGQAMLEEMKGVQADYIDAKFALLSPEERELYLELSQKIETGIREKLYTRRLSK